MAEKGKVFVPLDFRNPKKYLEPFVFSIDEDEEPACIRMDVFADTVHVSIKLDERAMEILYKAAMARHFELSKKLAFQRGAAHGAKRKR